VDLHLGLPLGNEAFGRQDQGAADQAPELEFVHDQAGFDGFAKADFVGQKETDTVLGDGPAEGPELVGERNYRGGGGRKEDVFT
jgi:hypothetical protein